MASRFEKSQEKRGYDALVRLTAPSLSPAIRRVTLREFAEINGWRPSDEIEDYPGTEHIANGHLLIEHGLDNAAVITFLKDDYPFSNLQLADQYCILGISYNNLVEWHFFPDKQGVTVVFNRSTPLYPRRFALQEEPNPWRAENFDRVTAERPNPNLKRLDDALIETLSLWKRQLGAELDKEIGNEQISALFNCLLLVRALEDQRRWRNPNTQRALIEEWSKNNYQQNDIMLCVKACLKRLGVNGYPDYLIDENNLRPFNALDPRTVARLFADFYENRFAPYKYDFSLMSKHALSRIYEHYVSLLRQKDSPQYTLFRTMPEETFDRSLGGIYTPQYIARFFARFLKEHLTPRDFRSLRSIDPACGSGIFLRTILEFQCDPLQEINMLSATGDAFKKNVGIDVDQNACQATRLSLALLHLVLTDRFPDNLNIVQSESLEYFSKHSELREGFDAVVANPPFVKWDRMSEDFRERVANFMGDLVKGKPDLFLGILKMGMELVKPGGFLLFVLPHAFLLAKSAVSLRRRISKEYWIHIIADLSEINVFEDVGSYVILLIIQRKPLYEMIEPRATIVKCKDFAGLALQTALEGKKADTDFYKVFELTQPVFSSDNWNLVPPRQYRLKTKIMRFCSLSDFLEVREGFITGADDVFIRDVRDVPRREQSIYAPYLSDREMEAFAVPKKAKKVVLYPFVNQKKLRLEDIQKGYPKTWQYLRGNERMLKARKSVISGRNPWWAPVRPRKPEHMMRLKIITPHLILLPKFSLDLDGKYAVSHCPLMYPKISGDDANLLRYFLAVLNSTIGYWQITALSHKYRGGYFMLEPKTIKQMSVPDPSKVASITMRQIQQLVKKRIQNPEDATPEEKLDAIVADLYALNKPERLEIGMEI